MSRYKTVINTLDILPLNDWLSNTRGIVSYVPTKIHTEETIVIPLTALYNSPIERFRATISPNALVGLYYSTSLVDIDANGVPTSYVKGESVQATNTITLSANANEYFQFQKTFTGYVYIVANYTGIVADGTDLTFDYQAKSSIDYVYKYQGAQTPYTIETDITIDGVVYRATDSYGRPIYEKWSACWWDTESELIGDDRTSTVYNVGQLVKFSGCYEGQAHFLGWWSNANATGTCYSTDVRFIMEMPSNNMTMYACYTTTPTPFDWDFPKVQGGIFIVTAKEFNACINIRWSHLNTNEAYGSDYRPMVADLSPMTRDEQNPARVIKGEKMYAWLYQHFIRVLDSVNYDTVINTYGVYSGEPITAALFAWFKDYVNNNYF